MIVACLSFTSHGAPFPIVLFVIEVLTPPLAAVFERNSSVDVMNTSRACRLHCAVFIIFLVCVTADVDGPYRLPTLCEVCKIFTIELKDRLAQSAKNKEILKLGQGLDDRNKKAVNYERSELRLIEAIHEPHICDEMKAYNVHAERKGSLRYAKGRSETMSTLHGLKDRGVKVDLGIPEELWDSQNAEVGQMMRQCYGIVEEHEEDIEDWYQGGQEQDIADFLCREIILKDKDAECLDEVWTGVERISSDKDSESKDEL